MLKECGVGSLQKEQCLELAVSGDAVSAAEGYFGPCSYVYSSQHRGKPIARLGYLWCIMDKHQLNHCFTRIQTDIVV